MAVHNTFIFIMGLLADIKQWTMRLLIVSRNVLWKPLINKSADDCIWVARYFPNMAVHDSVHCLQWLCANINSYYKIWQN